MNIEYLVNEIKLGSVLYLREDLSKKVYLYDVLQTGNFECLYYMIDDERSYKRSEILTPKERRKLLIKKILK